MRISLEDVLEIESPDEAVAAPPLVLPTEPLVDGTEIEAALDLGQALEAMADAMESATPEAAQLLGLGASMLMQSHGLYQQAAALESDVVDPSAQIARLRSAASTVYGVALENAWQAEEIREWIEAIETRDIVKKLVETRREVQAKRKELDGQEIVFNHQGAMVLLSVGQRPVTDLKAAFKSDLEFLKAVEKASEQIEKDLGKLSKSIAREVDGSALDSIRRVGAMIAETDLRRHTDKLMGTRVLGSGEVEFRGNLGFYIRYARVKVTDGSKLGFKGGVKAGAKGAAVGGALGGAMGALAGGAIPGAVMLGAVGAVMGAASTITDARQKIQGSNTLTKISGDDMVKALEYATAALDLVHVLKTQHLRITGHIAEIDASLQRMISTAGDTETSASDIAKLGARAAAAAAAASNNERARALGNAVSAAAGSTGALETAKERARAEVALLIDQMEASSVNALYASVYHAYLLGAIAKVVCDKSMEAIQ